MAGWILGRNQSADSLSPLAIASANTEPRTPKVTHAASSGVILGFLSFHTFGFYPRSALAKRMFDCQLSSHSSPPCPPKAVQFSFSARCATISNSQLDIYQRRASAGHVTPRRAAAVQLATQGNCGTRTPLALEHKEFPLWKWRGSQRGSPCVAAPHGRGLRGARFNKAEHGPGLNRGRIEP